MLKHLLDTNLDRACTFCPRDALPPGRSPFEQAHDLLRTAPPIPKICAPRYDIAPTVVAKGMSAQILEADGGQRVARVTRTLKAKEVAAFMRDVYTRYVVSSLFAGTLVNVVDDAFICKKMGYSIAPRHGTTCLAHCSSLETFVDRMLFLQFVACQLDHTLQCMHLAGFEYGDLHHGNILVADKHVILIDFESTVSPHPHFGHTEQAVEGMWRSLPERRTRLLQEMVHWAAYLSRHSGESIPSHVRLRVHPLVRPGKQDLLRPVVSKEPAAEVVLSTTYVKEDMLDLQDEYHLRVRQAERSVETDT